MKILVTGRDGQLARSLAEVGTGRNLVFVGRPEFDMLDRAGMERVIEQIQPALIVNAAAYTGVDAAEDDFEAAMAVNGVAPGVIARAATRIGARMIQVSTDYVFDGGLDRAYREDDPTSPIGVYGRTKLAGERAFAAAGVQGAILRTAWVYGPFGTNFIKTMLRLAAARDEIAVVGDQVGSPTSSLALAETVLRLIDGWQRHDAAGGTTVFHAAGSATASWADVARSVFAAHRRLTGKHTSVREIPTRDYPTKAPRPLNSTLNSRKLTQALRWSLPPWTDTVPATVTRILHDQRWTIS